MSHDSHSLHRNAQKIQDILDARGLSFKVIEFPSGTRTARDAASAIGCEVAQIVKSLVFVTRETQQPVLVLASGVNRIDEGIIAGYVGESIKMADADFVREVTGFAIGGVPPIGHKKAFKFTFIDEDLFKFPLVWAAAGTPHAVFRLASSDIESLTGGKIISLH